MANRCCTVGAPVYMCLEIENSFRFPIIKPKCANTTTLTSSIGLPLPSLTNRMALRL